ncbi:MAG: TolC family protein, partial [Bacteroidales bacterium]|nr:TolC family protein [Bacteroidales bacterium]
MNTKRIILLALSITVYTCITAQELLTLSRALEIAAINSPDLRLSALSLEQSEESLKAQKAALKSDFNLSLNPLSYSNQLKYDDRPDGDGWYNVQQTTSGGTFAISQPILLTDATLGLSNSFQWQNANGNESYYNKLTLRIDQPLFSHNVQKMALKEVKLDVEDAQLSYALQKLSMELSITTSFYAIYSKQLQVIIYRDELNNLETSYDIIQKKVNAGLATRENLYQSEVNLISGESALENALVNLENAKDDFKVVLGMLFSDDFLTVINIMVDAVPVEQNQAIERSLTAKRELRQREIDIEVAEFALISTMDNNGFQGNLSLEVGLSGQDALLLGIYNKPLNNKGIGISFEVPVWDWGKRKAKIRYAELSLERKELLLLNDRREIELTIRKLYRNLDNQLLQIAKAEKNVENAQLSYDTKLESYKSGKASSMDLQLVQNQLSTKKMTQTNAIINYKIELLNMKIQTLYD